MFGGLTIIEYISTRNDLSCWFSRHWPANSGPSSPAASFGRTRLKIVSREQYTSWVYLDEYTQVSTRVEFQFKNKVSRKEAFN